MIRRFNRYKQNCGVVTTHSGDFVLSYSTNVAKIDYAQKTVKPLDYWSRTTSKHINYVAKQLNLKVLPLVEVRS